MDHLFEGNDTSIDGRSITLPRSSFAFTRLVHMVLMTFFCIATSPSPTSSLDMLVLFVRSCLWGCHFLRTLQNTLPALRERISHPFIAVGMGLNRNFLFLFFDNFFLKMFVG
eukprot:TRINITY_DN1234_c7_g1_i1.p1 TRINITY_DN1234_c7_g1~~TRINITY_DN1234_c7_g1_i1.p1  ORF type:complete len:112 (-),score=10.91 TRINITY_DN1234_c7_g1_i1:667-1002(-)